jgi:peroxiredoxin
MNNLRLSFVLSFILVIFSSNALLAKDGYKIQVHFTDVTEDAKIFLCHYYGKGGTVFKDDSTTLKAGKGVMQSSEKVKGGIYILLFKDQSANMELILRNGDDFSITTKKKDIVPNVKFKGKTENDLFYGYQRFLVDYGKGFTKLKTAYSQAKTKDDSTAIGDQMKNKGKELINYRKGIIRTKPKTFLATLFRALQEPDVPKYKDWPLKEDGKKDSTFPSRYYKKHYWDGYDFQDDRLIITPMYEPKLKNYMDKWVIPIPDTVKKECDILIKKAEGTEETYKYTLWYLTRWAETSKIMGMEEVFVYLVEEYYMKGKATWLKPEQLKKYEKRAGDIAPNMIGKPAMDLKVRNMNNQFVPLYSVKANYTLLIFWEADCGHCKKELPKIDSLYKGELYKYGLQIFAVESSNEVEKWKKVVKEKKLRSGWIHTYDPDRSTKFRSFYDVYVTPTIYLLDENKKIIGRRINHSNILDVIKYHEKKRNEEKTK